MELQLQTTPVFEQNWEALGDRRWRYIVHQGGTGSSKTTSIAQGLILLAIVNPHEKLVIDILRKTGPALRATVMKDFFDILSENRIYVPANHDKSYRTYRLNNTLFRFFSVDEPIKVRGNKCDIRWMNEANEFLWEDFKQLRFRTRRAMILDYNPSDEFHWIYERVVPRDNCRFIQSTFMDNVYLPTEILRDIVGLQEESPEDWMVYGEGKPAKVGNLVFTNWDIEDLPEKAKSARYHWDYTGYGLDFGYNHPAVLEQIFVKEIGKHTHVWIDEILYERRLTTAGIIRRMNDLKVKKDLIIFSDHEEDRINEIADAGYLIQPANKAVLDGILALKRVKLHLTKRSVETQQNFRAYKWKVNPKTGERLDDPVKFRDDGPDAVRYAYYSYLTEYGEASTEAWD